MKALFIIAGLILFVAAPYILSYGSQYMNAFVMAVAGGASLLTGAICCSWRKDEKD